jgi:BirA family biotin operon repressor/biotin-[acetyl-CoA-carboxylase] ligase
MKIEKINTISSTNQVAKELAQKGAEPWTTVVAGQQTAGYGKEKVSWFSPEGGLYFSVILPKSQIDDLQTLTVLAAFIVARSIKNSFSLEPLIKLPNDVLVNQKKIAGILTENIIGKEVKASVIGIGINTNIDEFPQGLEKTATSLKIETGKEIDNDKILEQILKGLKEQLKTISQ